MFVTKLVRVHFTLKDWLFVNYSFLSISIKCTSSTSLQNMKNFISQHFSLLPQVSLALVTNIFSNISANIHKNSKIFNGILRGTGDTDS
jgi:hypothetical protein